MRRVIWLLVFVFSLVSCTKPKENFKHINYSLKYDYIDSIAKKINPTIKYDYWGYITFSQSFDGKSKYTILKEIGNTKFKKNFIEKFKPFGFFERGHPSYRCNFILTINNGVINYLNTEKELINFIGSVDNLEEALLIAKCHGYRIDSDKRASEYFEFENGFKLHLAKFTEFPLKKELIEITINKDATIETKNLGILKISKEERN